MTTTEKYSIYSDSTLTEGQVTYLQNLQWEVEGLRRELLAIQRRTDEALARLTSGQRVNSGLGGTVLGQSVDDLNSRATKVDALLNLAGPFGVGEQAQTVYNQAAGVR